MTRDQIVDLAYALDMTEQDVDDAQGPGKFEGNADRELAVAIYRIVLNGFADDTTGGWEYGTSVDRVNRWIMYTDSDGMATDSAGFVTVFEYDSVDDAQKAFDVEDERYLAWAKS